MLDIKVTASIQAALLFFIIGSPTIYNFTQKIFGRLITISQNNTPTLAGLLLHAIVYGLVTYIVMRLSIEYFEIDSLNIEKIVNKIDKKMNDISDNINKQII